jgi:hypothetical protein
MLNLVLRTFGTVVCHLLIALSSLIGSITATGQETPRLYIKYLIAHSGSFIEKRSKRSRIYHANPARPIRD